jgi:hypothetical protein
MQQKFMLFKITKKMCRESIHKTYMLTYFRLNLHNKCTKDFQFHLKTPKSINLHLV